MQPLQSAFDDAEAFAGTHPQAQGSTWGLIERPLTDELADGKELRSALVNGGQQSAANHRQETVGQLRNLTRAFDQVIEIYNTANSQ